MECSTNNTEAAGLREFRINVEQAKLKMLEAPKASYDIMGLLKLGDSYKITIEVSNLPIEAKTALHLRENLEEIKKCSGTIELYLARGSSSIPAAITLDELQNSSAGDTPLSICFNGTNEQSVMLAIHMVEDLVNNSVSSETNDILLGVENILVGMESAPPSFKLISRVCGEGGGNLQLISRNTGAEVTLRGQGSGFLEPGNGHESSEPLHIRIEHKQNEVLNAGRLLAMQLLDTIQEDLNSFELQHQLMKQQESTQFNQEPIATTPPLPVPHPMSGIPSLPVPHPMSGILPLPVPHPMSGILPLPVPHPMSGILPLPVPHLMLGIPSQPVPHQMSVNPQPSPMSVAFDSHNMAEHSVKTHIQEGNASKKTKRGGKKWKKAFQKKLEKLKEDVEANPQKRPRLEGSQEGVQSPGNVLSEGAWQPVVQGARLGAGPFQQAPDHPGFIGYNTSLSQPQEVQDDGRLQRCLHTVGSPSVAEMSTTITLTTWNVKGCKSRKDRDNIDIDLQGRGDIVALQQTHLQTIKEDTSSFSWYCSGGDSACRSGVAILLRKKSEVQMEKFIPVTDRLCTAQLRWEGVVLNVVCCYLPDSSDRDYEKTCSDLVVTLKEITGPMVVLGDFDAQIGKNDLTEQDRFRIGQALIHDVSDTNGLYLRALAEKFDLSFRNTWSVSHTVRTTRMDGKTSSQVDHILISRHKELYAFQALASFGIKKHSDHKILQIRLKIKDSTSLSQQDISPKMDHWLESLEDNERASAISLHQMPSDNSIQIKNLRRQHDDTSLNKEHDLDAQGFWEYKEQGTFRGGLQRTRQESKNIHHHIRNKPEIMYLTTWNVGGCVTPEERNAIDFDLRFGGDIIGVQETSLETGQLETTCFTWYCSGGANTGVGVAILVRKGRPFQVEQFLPISDCLCSIDLNWAGIVLTVVCCYLPAYTDNRNSEVRADLSLQLAKIKGLIGLLGDFDAQIGISDMRPQDYGRIGNTLFHEVTNQNGIFLKVLAEKYDLYFRNTWSFSSENELTTWDDGTTQLQVAHILMSNSDVLVGDNAIARFGVSKRSHHKILQIQLHINWKDGHQELQDSTCGLLSGPSSPKGQFQPNELASLLQQALFRPPLLQSNVFQQNTLTLVNALKAKAIHIANRDNNLQGTSFSVNKETVFPHGKKSGLNFVETNSDEYKKEMKNRFKNFLQSITKPSTSDQDVKTADKTSAGRGLPKVETLIHQQLQTLNQTSTNIMFNQDDNKINNTAPGKNSSNLETSIHQQPDISGPNVVATIKPKLRIGISTWNVMGCINQMDREAIDSDLYRENDIVALQETHMPSGQLETLSFSWFCSGGVNNNRRGVAILLRKYGDIEMIDFTPISDCLCSAKLRCEEVDFTVICCYLPAEPGRENEEVRKDLSLTLLETTGRVVLLGDFSVRLGKKDVTASDKKMLGCMPLYEESNENGLFLKSLAEKSNLHFKNKGSYQRNPKGEIAKEMDKVIQSEKMDEVWESCSSQILHSTGGVHTRVLGSDIVSSFGGAKHSDYKWLYFMMTIPVQMECKNASATRLNYSDEDDWQAEGENDIVSTEPSLQAEELSHHFISWNVEDCKLYIKTVENEMQRNGDIVALQGTHLSSKSFETSSFLWFCSGGADTPSTGVAILLRKNSVVQMKKFHSISEFLCYGEIHWNSSQHTQGVDLTVVCCYLPVYSDKENVSVRSDLYQLMTEIKGPIILVGNFNAQIGKDYLSAQDRKRIGKMLYHKKTNENGVYLKGLAEKHDLIFRNTLTSRTDLLVTVSWADGQYRSQVDHILISNSEDLFGCSVSGSLGKINEHSGHKILRMRLKSRKETALPQAHTDSANKMDSQSASDHWQPEENNDNIPAESPVQVKEPSLEFISWNVVDSILYKNAVENEFKSYKKTASSQSQIKSANRMDSKPASVKKVSNERFGWLCSWHVRGGCIRPEEREDLEKDMEDIFYPAICCLQETHLPTGTVESSSYIWHCSGGHQPTTSMGVAILMKKSSDITLRSFSPESAYVCVAEVIHQSTVVFTVICCYLPPSQDPDYAQAAADITRCVTRAKPPIIVAGDFNAQLGIKDITKEDKKGKVGNGLLHDYTNSNGTYLLEIAKRFKLRVKTTFAKTCTRVTCSSKSGYSQIDHILVTLSQAYLRSYCQAAKWAKFRPSDHKILILKMEFNKDSFYRKIQVQEPSNLQGPTVQDSTYQEQQRIVENKSEICQDKTTPKSLKYTTRKSQTLRAALSARFRAKFQWYLKKTPKVKRALEEAKLRVRVIKREEVQKGYLELSEQLSHMDPQQRNTLLLRYLRHHRLPSISIKKCEKEIRTEDSISAQTLPKDDHVLTSKPLSLDDVHGYLTKSSADKAPSLDQGNCQPEEKNVSIPAPMPIPMQAKELGIKLPQKETALSQSQTDSANRLDSKPDYIIKEMKYTHLCSWHIRGGCIRPEEREEVEKDVQGGNMFFFPEICCLQETHLPTGTVESSSYIWHCSGGPQPTTSMGVAILMKKSPLVDITLLSFNPESDHVCVAEVSYKSTVFSVVCCYLPPSDDPGYTQAAANITRCVTTAKPPVIVAGDFNAQIGKNECQLGLGHNRIHDSTNENGSFILAMAQGLCLVFINLHPRSKTLLTTCSNKCGDSQIDHILVTHSHTFKGQVHKGAKWAKFRPSDHKILFMRIKILDSSSGQVQAATKEHSVSKKIKTTNKMYEQAKTAPKPNPGRVYEQAKKTAPKRNLGRGLLPNPYLLAPLSLLPPPGLLPPLLPRPYLLPPLGAFIGQPYSVYSGGNICPSSCAHNHSNKTK